MLDWRIDRDVVNGWCRGGCGLTVRWGVGACSGCAFDGDEEVGAVLVGACLGLAVCFFFCCGRRSERTC